MDQHPCAGKLSDEIGSAYPTLEVHAFPDAPLLRGSPKAGLLRTVSEEAKHRFSVLHVPKSSKREDRRPSRAPGAPPRRCLWCEVLDTSRRPTRRRARWREASSCLVRGAAARIWVLNQDDGRSLLSLPHGRQHRHGRSSQHPCSGLEHPSRSKFTEQAHRWVDTTTDRAHTRGFPTAATPARVQYLASVT